MYTAEQIEMMKEVMREYLYFFKYTDHPNGQADPDTTFFTYDGVVKHDAVLLEKSFGGFKRINANSQARAIHGNPWTQEFKFGTSHPVDIGIRSIGTISTKLSVKER